MANGADGKHVSGRAAISRTMVISAVAGATVILLVAFLAFPSEKALQQVLGGALASLLALLLVFIFRETLLKPVDQYLSEDSVRLLADSVATAMQSRVGGAPGVVCFSRWNDIRWPDLLVDAMRLEFFVSYMDTWVNLAADPLLAVFERGGEVVVYLPDTSDASVGRVLERFSEYSSDLIRQKILNTKLKLEQLHAQAANAASRVTVHHTEVFIMHCLMRIDTHKLLLSPFDHFRRSKIEGPAFLVDTRDYTHIAVWADKEFEGFRAMSDSQGSQ